MAGRQLAALQRRLLAGGRHASTPVFVVSNAGARDERTSELDLSSLAEATMLHGGRPLVVIVGAGATPVAGSRAHDARTVEDRQASLTGVAP
jgi:uroporphyrin-III C-methyltransferase